MASGRPARNPGFRIWSAISQAQRDCWKTLAGVPGAELETEILRRSGQPGRFAGNPVLAHLEENWARPTPWRGGEAEMRTAVRAVVCANPEAEAIFAAREILKFVRGGGRFRECAVLVRSLEGYHDVLRRIFSRYGIPYFFDRREPSAHHPLAELTRNALRVAAFDWRHEDWFSALKTGLVSGDEEAVDRLENEALARGWKGGNWTTPFPNEDGKMDVAEQLRQQWVTPFLRFRRNLNTDGQLRPTGPQLAGALRELWRDLRVEEALTKGGDGTGLLLPDAPSAMVNPQLNATVWQQMNAWLDDMALAFAGEALWLTEWLAVLEAGLGGFTVGGDSAGAGPGVGRGGGPLAQSGFKACAGAGDERVGFSRAAAAAQLAHRIGLRGVGRERSDAGAKLATGVEPREVFGLHRLHPRAAAIGADLRAAGRGGRRSIHRRLWRISRNYFRSSKWKPFPEWRKRNLNMCAS